MTGLWPAYGKIILLLQRARFSHPICKAIQQSCTLRDDTHMHTLACWSCSTKRESISRNFRGRRIPAKFKNS